MIRIISGQITCLWLNDGITPVGTMLLKLPHLKHYMDTNHPYWPLEVFLEVRLKMLIPCLGIDRPLYFS
jgi:hypothetical protein